MKKAKNEAVAESNAKIAENKQKNKAAEKDNGIPSDKIRGKEKSGMEYPFKKVLYGYDPEEVSAYITELNETYESASRIHESKLSSMKEELVLSNRERDSLNEKYKECKAELEKSLDGRPQMFQPHDNSAEYEETIAALHKKLELSERENENLRKAAESKNEVKALEYTDRIAALEKEKAQLAQTIQLLQTENGELTTVSQKYNGLFESYNSVLSQYEVLKSKLLTKEDELKALLSQLEDKSEEIKTLYAENEDVKKLNAELEVRSGVLEKRAEENETEILRLKDVNKQQAFEYAEKINAMESEQAKSKLAMQKELQLHNYHIGQAEIILSEMAKQMEQIKQSLNDIQSV